MPVSRVRNQVVGIAAVAAGILLMPCAVMGQEGQFYLGGSFGQAEASGFCGDMNTLVAGIGVVSNCDEKDSAWKLFGGYQINPNVAVEVTYFNYGGVAATGQTFGVPFRVTGDATAFGIAGVGIVPLGRLALFGKFGFLRSEVDVAASGVGGSGSESDSETGIHFGLGAMLEITKNVSLRAEWESNDELEVDMMSVGVQVRF
jgi:OmpA-OmpF porin, OOP family